MSVAEVTQPFGDEDFDYMLVPVGPGIVRAEMVDGVAIATYGRKKPVQGRKENVRIRLKQAFPNAREIATITQVTRAATVAKRGAKAQATEDTEPVQIGTYRTALPMCAPRFVKKPDPPGYKVYGDPMDEVRPETRRLLGVWQPVFPDRKDA